MKKIVLFVWILLAAAPAFGNVVTLQWNRNPEPDVVGYYVFRANTPGGYNYNMPLNTTPVPQPANGPVQYIDTTALNQLYYYVVRAVNSAGVQSASSNEAIANPLGPSAPTGLTVITVTATLNMTVNGVQVASGPPPLNYTIPRQSPPRSYAIVVRQQ